MEVGGGRKGAEGSLDWHSLLSVEFDRGPKGTGEGEGDSRTAGQHWRSLQEDRDEEGRSSNWMEVRVNLGVCACVRECLVDKLRQFF